MNCWNSGDVMKNRTVSIIMPAYNRANTIGKSIESCLNQSYQDIQLIIIDDHSSDNIDEVVSRYALKDFRILYLKNPREKKGANAARNTGIQRAVGKYIAFCDSDDYLLEDSIESRVGIFEKNPEVGMVYGDAYCERHNRRTDWIYDAIDSSTQKVYLMQELSLCIQSTIMYKRELIDTIGMLDEGANGWTDDGLVVAIGMRYPIKHCGKKVAVIVKQKESMTSHKRNLYMGLKRLLKLYRRDIIKYAGIKHYLVWHVRSFSNWLYCMERATKNVLIREIFKEIHIKVREEVRPYFRHYFE